MNWYVLVDEATHTVTIGDDFGREVPESASVFEVYDEAEDHAEQAAAETGYELVVDTIPF